MASILIVEDEKVLGKTCQEVLSDDGYDAHWVPSAEEALALLKHREFDLALIDIGLPGIGRASIPGTTHHAPPRHRAHHDDGVRRYADGHRRHEAGGPRFPAETT